MLGEIIDRCAETLNDPTYAVVSKWRLANSGAKVVGCFPVYTPQEMIHAAGMLPVTVLGGGNRVEIDHADSRIQSFVCSIVRSALELGLGGYLKEFDGMIFPSICDAARNLSGIWQRNFPSMLVEYLHLPQNMASSAAASYCHDELLRLKRKLERLAGRPITNDALRNSIRVFNENRALLRKLYELRALTPVRLSAREGYVLTWIGAVIPKEEHNAMLKLALDLVGERMPVERDRIRVIIEGSFCEQPPLELIEILEEAGCHIVDDDYLLGLRWFERDISEEGDPLQALADAYLHLSRISSVSSPGPRSRGTHLVGRCREFNADGVIFAAPKFCEPALFDLVLMKQALDREKIPHLEFEYEEKMSVFENVRAQVETFSESILFFSEP